MAQKPRPLPLAMLICDSIIDDRKTGKKSIIGMFNNINSDKVPCVHHRLNVFLSLTEGIGEYDGKLRCVSVADEKTVFQMEAPLRFQNPHQVLDFNFELNGLKFPEYGEYRFEFLCGEIPVISRKFTVSKTPGEKGDVPQDDNRP